MSAKSSGNTNAGQAAFEQNYLQSLIDSKQHDLVSEILSMTPREQQAHMAAAYAEEMSRLQAAPPPSDLFSNALSNTFPEPALLTSNDAALSHWQNIMSDLVSPQDEGDDRLFRDLYRSRNESSPRIESIASDFVNERSSSVARASLQGKSRADLLEIGRPVSLVDSIEPPVGSGVGGALAGGGYGGAGGGDEGGYSNIEPSLWQRTHGALAGGWRSGIENIREDWNHPSGWGKLNYAFAGGTLIQEGGADWAKQNSGNYLTEEQKETANAGLLPGAFGVLGTLAGAAAGPGGAWAGGIVGAGVGSGLQTIVGANEERSQASREIGDLFTSSLGEAASKLKDFSSQVESTGAATKQALEVLTTVAGVSPLGPNAGTGAGNMTNALGEYAVSNYASVAHQLKDPSVFGMALEFGQNGRLTGESYRSLGLKAAIEGNADALRQDNLGSQRAPLADNPAYQRAQKEMHDAEDGTGWGFTDHLINPADLWNRPKAFIHGLAISQNIENANNGDPTVAHRNELFKEFGLRREDEGFYQAVSGAEEARRTGIGLRGGSAAQIAAGSGLVHQSYLSQEADITQNVSALQMELAGNTDPKIATFLRTEIETNRENRREVENKDALLAKDDVSNLLGERSSLFSLNIARATLSGRSAASLEGDYSRQVEFLQGTAADPRSPFSPAERAEMKQSALELGYKFQESVFAEQGERFGLTSAVSQSALTRDIYAGKTYAEMQDDENRLLSGQEARAHELFTDASRPGVPYAEALKLRAEATGLETDTVRERYGFKMAGYTQNLSQQDERIGEMSLGVTQAKLFGSPDAVYAAQSNELDALNGKMRELTQIINAGGLSVDDFTAKMRERTQVEGQLAQTVAQRRDDRLASSQALASDQFTIDTAGLSHDVRIGGSGIVNFDKVNTDFQGIFKADQAGIDAFAVGTVGRHDAQAKLSVDQAHSRDYEDALVQFSPSAQARIGLIEGQGQLDSARHAFHRTMEAPWMDGSREADPFTRGLQVEKEIGGGLSRITGQERAETAFRTNLQGKLGADGKPLWDDAAQLSYVTDMDRFRQGREGLLDEKASIEHERIYNSVLPREIEGFIGRPEGGIGIAIAPLAAATAAGRGPYNPAFGGFGHHDNPLMTATGGTAQEGGAFGGWWHAAGGNRPPASAGQPAPAASPGVNNHALDNRELVSLAGQMVSLLRLLVQQSQRGSGQQPPHNMAGVMNYMQGLTPTGG